MGNPRKPDQRPGRAPHESSAAELGELWRSAVDAIWQRVGADTPPEGLAFLERAMDQGKAFFALAGGPGNHPSGDALWRQPFDLWQRAAAGVLAARPAAPAHGGPRAQAMHAYQQALLDYTGSLQGVAQKTLAHVAEAWRTRRASGQSPAGLRELFDLYVDLGEQHYHELVSSPAFAELSGRLINALVECVPGRPAASAPARVSDADASAASADASAALSGAVPDMSTLMAELGLGIEQTMAELQAFGEKLDVGIATLGKLGSIDVGTSERQAVHHDGKVILYRYEPCAEVTNPTPVLIVYALANRPYMMDLQPKRSLVRGLMEKGLEVYLIDWGYPDNDDRRLGLDDYIDGFIDGCVESIRRRHRLDRINLLGVCQGGTFSLCYSALNPEKIRNLVLMVTPVDFHTPDNLLTAWLRHVDVDAMVDALGNIPGTLLNWAFVSMKPLRLTSQKYLDMLDLLDDEDKAKTFLRMEKWIHDSPDQAGECFRQFVKDLYQQNKLVEGGLQIGGRRVDLHRITMPVLNIYAAHDHIVPPAATLALGSHVATGDYTTCEFEGGHIGIYVSAKAQQEVPGKIAEWLHARSQPEPQTSP
jgi:polyhydroxyalkanoate synthase